MPEGAADILGATANGHLGDGVNYWTHVLPFIVLMAFGMGLNFVPLTLVAVHRLRAQDSGIGSGVLNTMQQVGGALGLATLSTVALHFTTARAEEVAPQLGAAAQGRLTPEQLGQVKGSVGGRGNEQRRPLTDRQGMGSSGTGQQQDDGKTSGKDMFHCDLQARKKTASTGHINPFVRSNNRAGQKKPPDPGIPPLAGRHDPVVLPATALSLDKHFTVRLSAQPGS